MQKEGPKKNGSKGVSRLPKWVQMRTDDTSRIDHGKSVNSMKIFIIDKLKNIRTTVAELLAKNQDGWKAGDMKLRATIFDIISNYQSTMNTLSGMLREVNNIKSEMEKAKDPEVPPEIIMDYLCLGGHISGAIAYCKENIVDCNNFLKEHKNKNIDNIQKKLLAGREKLEKKLKVVDYGIKAIICKVASLFGLANLPFIRSYLKRLREEMEKAKSDLRKSFETEYRDDLQKVELHLAGGKGLLERLGKNRVEGKLDDVIISQRPDI